MIARKQAHQIYSQIASITLAAALFIGIAGCAQPQDTRTQETAPAEISRTIQAHEVTITITITPATIDPREDALLSIQTRFPSTVQVEAPAPVSALEGFSIAAVLSPPDTRLPDGTNSRETTLRITPDPGANYRIAPMLFTITSATDPKQEPSYLITPAIRPANQRVQQTTDAQLQSVPQPLYIPPTPLEIARWILFATLAIVTIAAIYLAARKLRRRIQIFMMSPTERARYELEQLLAKDLPAKGEFKAFYSTITAIIRTYIEKRHGVRAPELTTPEFLAAAAKRPEFAPNVVERLKRFLESADLVKFAAWQPTSDAVQETIETARNYIAEDAPAGQPERRNGHAVR